MLEHEREGYVGERAQQARRTIGKAAREGDDPGDDRQLATEHEQADDDDMIHRISRQARHPRERADMQGVERTGQLAVLKLDQVVVMPELVPVDRPAKHLRELDD